MTLQFYKYQGTGNDFVMVDNRQGILSKNNTKTIKLLCDRKFGIGGDGLILLENDETEESDFKMVYFNSDGNESSMCGNGGRCIVAFANYLGIIKNKTIFTAIDGLHEAKINDAEVSLKMKNVQEIQNNNDFLVLDTGSPHYVSLREDIKTMDIKKEGATIRYSEAFAKEGINVNFVFKNETASNFFDVRTYERGVEDETLSCGTGVTAVALAMHTSGLANQNEVQLKTMGGNLKVSFSKTENGYENIWLSGPAEQVFEGKIKI